MTRLGTARAPMGAYVAPRVPLQPIVLPDLPAGGAGGGPPFVPPNGGPPRFGGPGHDAMGDMRRADADWRAMEQRARLLRPEPAIAMVYIGDDRERNKPGKGREDGSHGDGDGDGDDKRNQKDPYSPKDILMHLTGAKNDAELTDIAHHRQTFDPKQMSERLGEVEKKLEGLAAQNKLSPETQKIYEALRDEGTMKINLSPDPNSHSYINIRRSDVGSERAALMESAAKEPRAVFANSIAYGGKESATTTPGASVLALGPRGADIVISRERESPSGSKVIENETTAQHALAGHVTFGVHADVAKGTVTQIIVGVGEDHSRLTGMLNLTAQKDLFGGLMKRSEAVMEQMGRDNREGRPHDEQALRKLADQTPATLGETLAATKMYMSSLYQGVSTLDQTLTGHTMFGARAPVPETVKPGEPLDLQKHPELALKALGEALPGHNAGHELPARGPEPVDISRNGSGIDPKLALATLRQASPAQQLPTHTRDTGVERG